MTIDRKRIDAVKTLEALGYVYKDGQWVEDDNDWLDDGEGEHITQAFIDQYKANVDALTRLNGEALLNARRECAGSLPLHPK